MITAFRNWLWKRQYINQPIEKRLMVAHLIHVNRY
jgi:hypothetical protein